MARHLIFVALFALASAELIKIPLIKKRNHVLSIENVRVERTYAMQKYHTSIDVELQESEECVVNMDNFINNEFYAEISVGTPPQVLNATFDTSAFALYAVDDRYKEEDSTSSTIVQQSVEFIPGYDEYQDGYSNYTIVEDIFNLGLNVKLTFGINSFEFQDVDVIFGLGGHLQQQLLAPPLFYMLQQGIVNNLEYSLYYDTKSDSDFGGHVIFGGVDSSLYSGYLTTVPYTDNLGVLSLNIDSCSINGVSIGINTTGIIDSGLNLIGVPVDYFVKISEKLGGVIDEEGNYFVSCDKVDSLPNVSLSIGGTEFVLTPQDYILRVTKGFTQCMSSFTYLGQNQRFSLGLPFLKTVYTSVNMKEKTVGFATLA